MQMTFTVLVTVETEERAAYSDSRIAKAIQLALEEGNAATTAFLSAQVDAFKGVRLTERTLAGSDLKRYKRIAALHNARVSA